jgi:hypothetical protein
MSRFIVMVAGRGSKEAGRGSKAGRKGGGGAAMPVADRGSNVGLHMASAGFECRPMFFGYMAAMLAPMGPALGKKMKKMKKMNN